MRGIRAWVLGGAVGLGLVAPNAGATDTNATAGKDSDHEFTIVPVAGGSSDIGLGLGYVASLAGTRRGVRPYVWRLESAGAVAARFGDGARLGYLDDYLLLIVPRAFGLRLRLEATLGYTDEPELTYFGLGNASRPDPGRASNDAYFTFERANGHGGITATYTAYGHFQLIWGLAGSVNHLAFPADGRLARELERGDAVTRELLNVRHSLDVVTFSYGVGWDSRDNEVSTYSGQYHTLRVDLSPGGAGVVPYAWGRANLTLRGYVPIVRRRITFAARGVLDMLFGDAPFYELSRFDDTQAVGGGRGVRGVPAARYYGRLKTFLNLELRTELLDFRAFDKQNTLGLTAFFDGGRVFSELPRARQLDGSGVGLKFGTGLGARLKAGDSFVVRGDVAWSPDASPVSAYLLAGQSF